MGKSPRLIRPGATFAICRRVEGRRYLLRPDARFNALFMWLLAVMAERHGIQVHIAVCMSTHFHLVVTVPETQVSDFMHDFDLCLSRALKRLRRHTRGVVWEPGRLSIVELLTPEAVAEQIAYALVNPVAAALVYEYDQWPGVRQLVEEMGRGVIGGTRPDFFFTAEHWPLHKTTRLVLPQQLMAQGADEARRLIGLEVEHQQQEARAQVRAKRWNVLGANGARRMSPYKYAKSWDGLHTMAPAIAAGRGQKEARIQGLEELMEFRVKHREAKARWCEGDREVVFPAGTYWMRVHHGVRVAPWPD